MRSSFGMNARILEADRAWLQRALDGEELVADLLAVQVLDGVVRQADVLELAEGVPLHTCAHRTLTSCPPGMILVLAQLQEPPAIPEGSRHTRQKAVHYRCHS